MLHRWGAAAANVAQEENQQLAAGAEPLDPEAQRLEYSYWKVLKMKRRWDQHASANRQGDAAGASTGG